MARVALETGEVDVALGEPLMAIFLVALEADPISLAEERWSQGSRLMGIMTFKTEATALLGMRTTLILLHDFAVTLTAIYEFQALRMGHLLDFGMTTDAGEFSVD